MKKIMFNDRYGLTEAVLQERKPMTRRLCKEYLHNDIILSDEVESWSYYSDENLVEFLLKDGSVRVSVPPYKVGDIVAVAQSYKDAGIDPHFFMLQPIKGSIYFAEMETEAMFTGGWNNKMFVCADLMPHQIRFTDFKVEQLQDISDEDCLREGVLKRKIQPFDTIEIKYQVPKTTIYKNTPRGAFEALIDKVSGKGTWESNPFVFAYSFELVREGGNQ